MIKSINNNELEIQKNILMLYSKLDYYELDPCYSTGCFYKRGLKKPKFKFDINPKLHDVKYADVRDLPLPSQSVNSVIFDPPFVIGVPNSSKNVTSSNKTFNRFAGFFSKEEQTKFYYDSLKSLYKVLKCGGIIAFKCQDTVSSGKQYIVHHDIVTMAQHIGFYVRDIFIYYKDYRMNSGKWITQRHARKHHCYYIVLEKKVKNPVFKNLQYINNLLKNNGREKW